MSTSAQAGPRSAAGKLGFTAGQVIQEYGYDSDVDDDLRFAIEDLTTTKLEDEDRRRRRCRHDLVARR